MRFPLVALAMEVAVPAHSQQPSHGSGGAAAEGEVMPRLRAEDVFLGGEAFSSDDEQSNLGKLYKWLDDVFWTELWDSEHHREMAYAQVKQLAALSTDGIPSLSFAVGQALYSYFWFKANGGDMDEDVVLRSIELHELSLGHSGCGDLTLPVGTFLSKACAERWLYLIMLCSELGAELAARRRSVRVASDMLAKADSLFHTMMSYSFFSFRNWTAIYELNTNSHVFDGSVRQRPIWPNEHIPLAGFLEANSQVFQDELAYILENNLFDTLYFAGRVSMTQFSGRRESWAPLNLIHNRELAPHACAVANRTCELLLSRPEIARCDARDVGAAFARLQPGMGIKPHFWNAPPRLGVHLGLRTPPGAEMLVGDQVVDWQEGKAVVFDDTYVHSVRHKGSEDRYLLIAWFCHPCDDYHAEVPAENRGELCLS